MEKPNWTGSWGKQAKKKEKENSSNMWNFPEAELFISEPEFTANNLINRDVWWSCAVCECWRKRVDSWQNSRKKRSVEMLMVCAHLACAHDIWAEFLSRLLSAPLRSSPPLRFRQLPRQDAPEFTCLDLMTHFFDVSDSSPAPPGTAKISPLPWNVICKMVLQERG